MNRRLFLKTSAGAGLAAGAPLVTSGWAKNSPNDTINVAVAGIRSRGQAHYQNYGRIKNAHVAAICDIDENLFEPAIDKIAAVSQKEPKTVVDFRKLLDDKDIDAVSIAAPDHWHALMTIWACQAGKDVYVEKPVSWSIQEGRQMIDAARKYNRIVQAGTQNVSDPLTLAAFDECAKGTIGDVYMGKMVVYDYRPSIGRKPDIEVPEGVNWDLFLGPAPKKPFNENRFHYNWHWMWDMSTSEFGNAGVHFIDMIRRVMQKQEHPTSAQCVGGCYGPDSDREVPDVQIGQIMYDDGKIIQLEVRNTFSNIEGGGKDRCCLLYGTKGWMYLTGYGGEYKTYLGPSREPGPSKSQKDLPPGEGKNGELLHFTNFLDCIRSRKQQDLKADILQGHLSTVIAHLGNVAYRTGEKLKFDKKTERFIGNEKANKYLTREYREPYAMPKVI